MSSFGANNMPPSATAGAYTGGMPHYPNANINLAPTYTSPAMYAPTYTSPESYGPYPMEYPSMHYHHHYHHKHAPVYAAAAAYGGLGTTSGVILVLFILLVIISRAIL
jgi:hypothetical protein